MEFWQTAENFQQRRLRVLTILTFASKFIQNSDFSDSDFAFSDESF